MGNEPSRRQSYPPQPEFKFENLFFSVSSKGVKLDDAIFASGVWMIFAGVGTGAACWGFAQFAKIIEIVQRSRSKKEAPPLLQFEELIEPTTTKPGISLKLSDTSSPFPKEEEPYVTLMPTLKNKSFTQRYIAPIWQSLPSF